MDFRLLGCIEVKFINLFWLNFMYVLCCDFQFKGCGFVIDFFFLKEEDLIIGKNFINNEEKYVFFRIDVFL